MQILRQWHRPEPASPRFVIEGEAGKTLGLELACHRGLARSRRTTHEDDARHDAEGTSSFPRAARPADDCTVVLPLAHRKGHEAPGQDCRPGLPRMMDASSISVRPGRSTTPRIVRHLAPSAPFPHCFPPHRSPPRIVRHLAPSAPFAASHRSRHPFPPPPFPTVSGTALPRHVVPRIQRPALRAHTWSQLCDLSHFFCRLRNGRNAQQIRGIVGGRT